jgi:hypothetical protein
VKEHQATLFRVRAPAGLVRTVVNTRDFGLLQVRYGPATCRCRLARTDPRRHPVHLAAPRASSCSAPDSEYAQLPADGETIVGPVAEVPGLYLAVMHSAVTLAPGRGPHGRA